MRGNPTSPLLADKHTRRQRRRNRQGLSFFRPRLEFLEGRLQPGDAFFGGFWGFGLLGLEINRPDPVWQLDSAGRPSRGPSLLEEGCILSGIALSRIEIASREMPPQPAPERNISGSMGIAANMPSNDLSATSSGHDLMMGPVHSVSYLPHSSTPFAGHEVEIAGGISRTETSSQSQGGFREMRTEKSPDLGPILLSSARSSPSFAGNLFFDRSTGLVAIRGDAGDNTVRESIAQDGFLEVGIDGRQYSSDPASVSFDRDLLGATESTLNGIVYENGGGHDTLRLGSQNSAGSFTVSAPGAEVVTQDIGVGGKLGIEADRITVGGALQGQEIGLSATGLISVETAGALVARNGDNGGRIEVKADIFVTTGQLHADGDSAGQVFVHARNMLNAGHITADGNHGTVGIAFTGSYIDTTAALNSVNGGHLTITGGTTGRLYTSGTHQATGTVGGTIDLLGREVVLNGATVDASGENGGGLVRIGGDFQGKNPAVVNAQTVTVTGAATIQANALQSGDGGRVVVWSDQETVMDGAVSARGGSIGGDGGFIEISAKGNLNYRGSANAGASSGKPGTLLLDPKNITIADAPAGVFPQFDLVDPHPSEFSMFANIVSVLKNGNVVITNHYDSFGGNMAGAVYLFDGLRATLISVIVGSHPNDFVGITDIIKLSNGNYVILSPNWNFQSGAVTWGSGATGVSGVVSGGNSLVGNSGDHLGCQTLSGNLCTQGGVIALRNGNYVVASPGWQSHTGAVTWGNGITGMRGAVSSNNSLVGVISTDQVASSGVIPLTNGNYVIGSPHWFNDRGATTWGSGTAGVRGFIGTDNSLVGSFGMDEIGLFGITPLANGNYVVDSPFGSLGAITWGDGVTGVHGTISAANSLLGAAGSLPLGTGGVTALSNGNYVVASPFWNGGSFNGRGAVTWGDGTIGTTGMVSEKNSLVGNPQDLVGSQGISALSNGNYVVRSLYWNGRRGAVTWGDGSKGISGIVSDTNSLVGANPNDFVGAGSVVPLNNGNYVVQNPSWNGGRGAVTWGDGNKGVIGTVSDTNSLVGDNPNDQVGQGVVTLANANFVVQSPDWHSQRGATTWGSGTRETIGTVSDANSLVGINQNDHVGYSVTSLRNGNYVVSSPSWNENRGAATWGSGINGISGTISEANSLVGRNPNDRVALGLGVTTLNNGNYVVPSPSWNGNRGAATWGDGSKGISGVVSDSNSLVGINPNDFVGTNGVAAMSNGNYVVLSRYYGQRGAATWAHGTSGQTLDGRGVITPQNSLLGRVAGAQLLSVVIDPLHQSFLARFIDVPERVTAGVTNPNQFNFARAQAQTVSLTPDYLTTTLNTGTDVVLQASNDIAVNSPISVNAGGNGGGLTLQAGRSILINANITSDNGALTLIANDQLANGVVDSQRDPGNAVITMAGGTSLNTGSGPLTVSLRDGAGLTNRDSGAITLQTINAGSVSVVNNGPSAGSAIILGSVTTSGSQSYASPNGTTTIGGNLTAAGNPITFTDSVLVNNGVTVDAGSSTVNFASNGTQTLQAGSGASFGNVLHNGTGTLQITSAISVIGSFTATAGTLELPTSSTGILTVAENISFTDAATVVIHFNGTDSSQMMGGGPIDLGGSALSLVFDSDPALGSPFTLLATADPGPIQSTFAGLDEGAIFMQGGFQFQITYMGGNQGNSVVVTRVA